MDLQTLADGAALYQRDPREILAGLSVAQGKHQPEPTLILNGLRYFKRDEITAAVKYLVEYDAAKAAKAAEA